MKSGKSTTGLEVDLARRIKAARLLTGKHATVLAAELGWSKEKLYRLEGGRQIPSAVDLAALAAVTGQHVSFFYIRHTSPGDGPILSPVAPPVNDEAIA